HELPNEPILDLQPEEKEPDYMPPEETFPNPDWSPQPPTSDIQHPSSSLQRTPGGAGDLSAQSPEPAILPEAAPPAVFLNQHPKSNVQHSSHEEALTTPV